MASLMPQVQLTEQRKSNLNSYRELLKNPRSDAAWIAKKRANRPYNDFLGLKLHACALFDEGKSLNQLDQLFIDQLRTFLPDEEIRQNGRLFRAMSLEDRKLLFPERIAQLNADSPLMSVKEYGKLRPTIDEIRSFSDDPQATEESREKIKQHFSQIDSLQEVKRNFREMEAATRAQAKVGCVFATIHCDDEVDAGESEVYCFGTVFNPDTEFVSTFRTKIYEDVGNGDDRDPEILLLDPRSSEAKTTMLPMSVVMMEADRSWEGFLEFLGALSDFLSSYEGTIIEILIEIAQEGLPGWVGFAIDVANFLYDAYKDEMDYWDPNKDDLIAKGGYSFKFDSNEEDVDYENRGSRYHFDFLYKVNPNKETPNFWVRPQIGKGNEGWYKLKFRIGDYAELHHKYPDEL
ncbi:MAG: hypothetical protein QNJ70_24750 [Xenococcaceae cyanobacterium MO_207.B15]|nr:hypothetical protein [Xenococcaceae cyanobacterium MO_207.B15]